MPDSVALTDKESDLSMFPKKKNTQCWLDISKVHLTYRFSAFENWRSCQHGAYIPTKQLAGAELTIPLLGGCVFQFTTVATTFHFLPWNCITHSITFCLTFGSGKGVGRVTPAIELECKGACALIIISNIS